MMSLPPLKRPLFSNLDVLLSSLSSAYLLFRREGTADRCPLVLLSLYLHLCLFKFALWFTFIIFSKYQHFWSRSGSDQGSESQKDVLDVSVSNIWLHPGFNPGLRVDIVHQLAPANTTNLSLHWTTNGPLSKTAGRLTVHAQKSPGGHVPVAWPAFIPVTHQPASQCHQLCACKPPGRGRDGAGKQRRETV